LPPPTKTYSWKITASESGNVQVNELAFFAANGNRIWPKSLGSVEIIDAHGNVLPHLLDGVTWNKWNGPLPATVSVTFTNPKQLSGFGFVYGNNPQEVPTDWTWTAEASNGIPIPLVIQQVLGFAPEPATEPTLTTANLPFTSTATVLDFHEVPSTYKAEFGNRVRWTITGLRSSTETMVQFDELEVWEGVQGDGGDAIPMSCHAPGSNSPHNEGIVHIADRNQAKFLDFNFAANGQTVIECTLDYVPKYGVTKYKFQTGNDHDTRDPWDWSFEVELDGELILVDSVEGGLNVPNNRNSWAEPGYGFQYPIPKSAHPEKPVWGTQVSWVITGARSATTMIQFAEFEVWEGIQHQGGDVIPMTCNSPGSNSPDGEGITFIDDRTQQKFLDFEFQAHGQTTIDCTLERTPDGPITMYKFQTGNDHEERDPFAWEFYAEVDGAMQLMDVQSGGPNVPWCRDCWAEPGYYFTY